MSQKMRKRVVAAILENSGKILICRRQANGAFPNQWEFPGGKVGDGESDEEALQREIQEELGIDIRIRRRFAEQNHDYDTLSVNLVFYLCETEQADDIKNYVHAQVRWEDPKKLRDYDFLAADWNVLERIETEF
jgi:mutator protein MutT